MSMLDVWFVSDVSERNVWRLTWGYYDKRTGFSYVDFHGSDIKIWSKKKGVVPYIGYQYEGDPTLIVKSKEFENAVRLYVIKKSRAHWRNHDKQISRALEVFGREQLVNGNKLTKIQNIPVDHFTNN